MIKKIISSILCVLILLTMSVALSACGDKEGSEYPVTVGDVTIDSEPKNIVVLSDCMSDIISCIGYDVKMVGRDIESDQEFLSVVPIVGTADNPSIDTIIGYECDLVICDGRLSDSSRKKFDEAEIPVVTLKRANTFEELKKLYSTLGAVLGGNITGKQKGENAYTDLISTLDSFKDAVRDDVVKTSCYLYLDENGNVCTLTKGTIEYDLFSYCGALNVFSTAETPEVDLKQLRMSTPSYIVYDSEEVIEVLKSNPELANMGALVDSRIYQMKKSDFDRQGITYEDMIYHLMETLFAKPEATPDEATPDEQPANKALQNSTVAATTNTVPATTNKVAATTAN